MLPWSADCTDWLDCSCKSAINRGACAVQLFACERSCSCLTLYACLFVTTGGRVVQVSEDSESVCVCDDCRTAHSIHTHFHTHLQCSFVSRLHHIHNLYIAGQEAVLVHLTISLRCNQAGVDTSGSLARHTTLHQRTPSDIAAVKQVRVLIPKSIFEPDVKYTTFTYTSDSCSLFPHP